MIAITNPVPIENEIQTIHALLENGLELLHVRKPNFLEEEMKTFLSEIKPDFRAKLVLHSHHQLVSQFGIHRIHYTENYRNSNPVRLQNLDWLISTSTHSMDVFNNLTVDFEYAFLSPVYASISKPNYVSEINLLEAVKKRTNFRTKLVALGGISSENCEKTIEAGFDDVALLGAIWNSKASISELIKCQKMAFKNLS